MLVRIYIYLMLAVSYLFISFATANADRLKDMTSIAGVRSNQLVGYGLVVGLAGTGDGNAVLTQQAMQSMISQFGVVTNAANMNGKNAASVIVTADLPPFIKPGQKLDVVVSTVGQAKSLQDEIQAAYDDYQFHHVYHRAHNFCSGELGGFYLDIIKDRQYTTGADSFPRRSAQTALFHLAEALCRWIAPILSFTAEEIWENLPGARSASVFLSQWYDGLPESGDSEERGFWTEMMNVRQQVNKALELAREQGALKGSLDASVTLFAEQALAARLRGLGEELRFVLITSEAQVAELDQAPDHAIYAEDMPLRILAAKSASEKCERCWHRREDVGSHAAHPTLCDRCVTNIEGDGEVRQFA